LLLATAGEHKPRPNMAPGDEAPSVSPSSGPNVCPACGGTGRVEGARCDAYGGTGAIDEAVGGG
jgi:hypothetical protein